MKTEMTTPQAIEELLARSACYHGLSVVLRYPGTETAKWLASQEHRRLIDVVEMWSPAGRNPERPRRGGGVEGLVKEEGRALRDAVRHLVTQLDAVSIPEWTQEHERIFGHSVQSAAPPYELEYGEEHSHRQPQELGDIAAFYQAFGLRASTASRERVDHMVAECEFMQYLLYKQACALDEGSQERSDVCEAAAKQFLADHLGRWGPAFALRLSREGGEGVLASVGELFLAWMIEECARLRIPVGSVDLPLRSPKERDDVGCAACLPAEAASGCSGAAQAGEVAQGRNHASA